MQEHLEREGFDELLEDLSLPSMIEEEYLGEESYYDIEEQLLPDDDNGHAESLLDERYNRLSVICRQSTDKISTIPCRVVATRGSQQNVGRCSNIGTPRGLGRYKNNGK